MCALVSQHSPLVHHPVLSMSQKLRKTQWKKYGERAHGICRGNVESSRGRGAIELGRERGFGDVGYSGEGIDTSLPSFGSHDGGVILRAAISHYKAISLG